MLALQEGLRKDLRKAPILRFYKNIVERNNIFLFHFCSPLHDHHTDITVFIGYNCVNIGSITMMMMMYRVWSALSRELQEVNASVLRPR